MDTDNFNKFHDSNMTCANPTLNIEVKMEVLSDEFHSNMTGPSQVFQTTPKSKLNTNIVKTEVINDDDDIDAVITSTLEAIQSASRANQDTENVLHDDPSLNLNIKNEVFNYECDNSETPQQTATHTCSQIAIVSVKTVINECDSIMADTSQDFHDQNPSINSYVKAEETIQCDTNMNESLQELSTKLDQEPDCDGSGPNDQNTDLSSSSSSDDTGSDFEPFQALKSLGRKSRRHIIIARCVNCGVNIYKGHCRQLNLLKVRRLIRQWVKPYQVKVSKKSLVCMICWSAAWRKIRDPMNQEPVPSIGQRKICIVCGKSVLRERSMFLKSDTPQALAIRNFLATKIPPHLLSDTTELCCACWRKFQRQVLKSEAPREQTKSPHDQNNDTEDAVLPVPQETKNEKQTIVLPNYARAPFTCSRCIFPHCKNSKQHLVPSGLRKSLLCDYKYYVPKGCRICEHHLRTKSWHLLGSIENPIRTFRAEHIEDFTGMLIQRTHMDFENIDNMPEHLVKYYLGVTREEFQTMLNKVPHLAKRRKGPLALALHLLKKKTGDNFTRISGLLQIPRNSVAPLIQMAQEYMIAKNGCATEDNESNSDTSCGSSSD